MKLETLAEKGVLVTLSVECADEYYSLVAHVANVPAGRKATPRDQRKLRSSIVRTGGTGRRAVPCPHRPAWVVVAVCDLVPTRPRC